MSKKNKLYKAVDAYITKFKTDNCKLTDDQIKDIREEIAKNAVLNDDNTITLTKTFIKDMRNKFINK